MDIKTFQDIVTLAKDIVTGLAACIAAYIGLVGLDTWKKQLTANAEHELARRVLVAVYKVRDAIEGCRLSAWEGDSEIVDVTKKIHDMNFEKLDTAKAGLDVELLEAEAVWGGELDYRTWVVRLTAIIQTLKFAYSTYYWDYRLSEAAASDEKAEAYSILFTKGTYPKDEFSIQIDKAVQQVEDFLRPKLTLKQAKRKKRHWWDSFKKQDYKRHLPN